MMKNENTKVEIINMADVEPVETDWLWYPYIPFGKITIICGDPGEGKTTLALQIASACSTGTPLPGEDEGMPLHPINVIYQTAEDGLSDTIKPRLVKAGADCTRIMVIDDYESDLCLDDKRIEQAIKSCNAGLIILDPLQAYLGASVDMHRANAIRPIFGRLAAIAEETNCAVLLIGHLNKAGGGKAIYRTLGSIDFIGAARSVLIVGKPSDRSKDRVMTQSKNNLAPIGDSVLFSIDEERGVVWEGFVDMTADDLVSGKRVQKKQQAGEFLKELLSNGKEVPATEIYLKMEDLGIGQRTVDFAKKKLEIQSIRKENKWFWKLPNEVSEAS